MLPLRYVTARSTQTRRDLSPHPTVLMEKHFNWSPFQKPHSRSRVSGRGDGHHQRGVQASRYKGNESRDLTFRFGQTVPCDTPESC